MLKKIFQVVGHALDDGFADVCYCFSTQQEADAFVDFMNDLEADNGAAWLVYDVIETWLFDTCDEAVEYAKEDYGLVEVEEDDG